MTTRRHPLRDTGWIRFGRITMIVLALVLSVAPLLYGVLLSIRPLSDVLNAPLDLFPAPAELDFSSYPTALRDEGEGGFGLARFMGNSALVAAGTVVLVTLFSILGAYASVRLRFFGRRAVNSLILAVYLFPGLVLAVPLFVLMSKIGLTGSLVGLLLIYVAQTVPVALYMLRNYFLAIPESVEEAARIDGCSLPMLLRKIVFPMALPGIVATGLYVFMIAWNEYLFALLFLVQDRERWTVALGLAQLTEFTVPIPVLMAGAVAITIPVVIIFFAAQKMLVSGLTAGAEK